MKKIGRNRIMSKLVEFWFLIFMGAPKLFCYAGSPRIPPFNEKFGGSCNVMPFRSIREQLFLATLSLTLFLLSMLT